MSLSGYYGILLAEDIAEEEEEPQTKYVLERPSFKSTGKELRLTTLLGMPGQKWKSPCLSSGKQAFFGMVMDYLGSYGLLCGSLAL